MYKRALASYETALRAFDRHVPFDYTVLINLPRCPAYKPCAPTSGRPQPGPSVQDPSNLSANQKRTIQLLSRRHGELRSAAAQCKAAGKIDAAKDFLRQSMVVQKMVQAVSAGLAIDLKKLPPPPPKLSAGGGSMLSGGQVEAPVDFQAELVKAGKG